METLGVKLQSDKTMQYLILYYNHFQAVDWDDYWP